MEFLTKAQVSRWLSGNGWEYLNAEGWRRQFLRRLCYRLPKDTGSKTVLGRQLLDIHHGDGLFWITDWGAYPNLGNMELFYGYRKYLGENRLLIEVPGHTFNAEERATLESLLHMSLYFFWDSILLWKDWDTVIVTSNDEFIDVYARTQQTLEIFKERLSNLEAVPN
jgi:hypothetical protein